MDALTARLDAVTQYGHRNRRMIWGLVISVVFDMVLTVGLAVSLTQASRASDQAAAVHRQQVSTCESSNEGRALNVKLWNYVLDFPSPKPRTDEQKKQITAFREFMAKTFAPRDCSKI